MTKIILFLFVILSWGLAQIDENTFSYTVEADQSHTVTAATSNAVAGAFYADERYNIQEEYESWQIILGVRGGEDFLTEKLRITMYTSPDNDSQQFSASFRSGANVEAGEDVYRGWINSETGAFDINITDGRAEGNFAISFADSFCISGNLSVDLTDEKPNLHLAVLNKNSADSDASIRFKDAYDALSFGGKNLAETYRLSWQGYEYVMASPLFGAPEKPDPIDVCVKNS